MPFALVTIGLLMIVTGARDTYADFGAKVVSEFQGPNNFTYWIAGIGGVGALGYYEPLRAFSRLFMTLIILTIFVKADTGFFDQFSAALKAGPVAPKTPDSENAGATPSKFGTTLDSMLKGSTKTAETAHLDPNNSGKKTPIENANTVARILGIFF